MWIEAAAREWDARSGRRWDWLRGDVMPFLDREGFCFCVCFYCVFCVFGGGPGLRRFGLCYWGLINVRVWMCMVRCVGSWEGIRFWYPVQLSLLYMSRFNK